MNTGGVGELTGRCLNDGLTLTAVRETFDHWRITESDGGYQALRAGAVTMDGPQSLIMPCVFAKTLEELADKLSLQEWLRRMTAEELGLVWRHGLSAVGGPRFPVGDGEEAVQR